MKARSGGEIPRIPTAEKRFLHVESVYVGQNKWIPAPFRHPNNRHPNKRGRLYCRFFSVGIFWTIPTKHKCSPTEVMIITIKLSTLGITPQKAKQFEKKGICSAEDLLRYILKSYSLFNRWRWAGLSCHGGRGEVLRTGTPLQGLIRSDFFQNAHAHRLLHDAAKWSKAGHHVVPTELPVPEGVQLCWRNCICSRQGRIQY